VEADGRNTSLVTTTAELRRLLSLVEFDERLHVHEGITPFRSLLERDAGGPVAQFLRDEFAALVGERRAAIAFVLAEHYRLAGDVNRLTTLFSDNDPGTKTMVLNALWGSPGSNPEMGAAIVQLALDGARHPDWAVRTEACAVIQNQCAWKTDVAAAVGPLLRLLEDASDRVRMQAACAVGNLAKRKYDLVSHIAPLGRNLRCADVTVRNYSAWALWQLSKYKRDIALAAADLVQALTADDEWSAARKNAAGALLHHAKKSQENRAQVRQLLATVCLNTQHVEVRRLQEQLNAAN
jgi:hypothetical protein